MTLRPWLKSLISVMSGPIAFFTARNAARSSLASARPSLSFTAEKPSFTNASASFAKGFSGMIPRPLEL